MKVADLKKGVEYAFQVGYQTDVRNETAWSKVVYVGPTAPEYDRWNPTKKRNPGMVDVRLTAELVVEDHLYKPLRKGAGEVISVPAKKLGLTWADLEVRAGVSINAGRERERYLEELKALVTEIDPSVEVERNRHYGWRDADKRARTVEVTLWTSETFDPEDAVVSMPAELFRKLLSGVKVDV